MTTVRITPGERDAAFAIGEKRQWLREHRGKSPAEYQDRGGTHVQRNQIGAAAEYAVAKHYGKDTLSHWCNFQSFSLEHWRITCDVGSNLHIRATAHPRGRLIVHPYDPDDGAFLHVVVSEESTKFTLLGWSLGAYVKQPHYWLNSGPGFGKRPAYVLPNDFLRPLDTLPPSVLLCPASAVKNL